MTAGKAGSGRAAMTDKDLEEEEKRRQEAWAKAAAADPHLPYIPYSLPYKPPPWWADPHLGEKVFRLVIDFGMSIVLTAYFIRWVIEIVGGI